MTTIEPKAGDLSFIDLLGDKTLISCIMLRYEDDKQVIVYAGNPPKGQSSFFWICTKEEFIQGMNCDA